MPLDAQGFFVFIRAVQMLLSENKGVIVVGVAGPSGSGKTIFSEKVSAFLQGTGHVSSAVKFPLAKLSSLGSHRHNCLVHGHVQRCQPHYRQQL